MGPKLLFLVGIVVTHGAVGAALMSEEDAPAPSTVSSCVYAPEPPPHFQAEAELLAMRVGSVTAAGPWQP